MQAPSIVRENSRIIATFSQYTALITCDRAQEIPDDYIKVLLSWAQKDWDWEAVEPENRAEDLRRSATGQVCYTLSLDDLRGLFAGTYGGSPGALPGWENSQPFPGRYVPDEWSPIEVCVWIPEARFRPEVLESLEVD